MAKKISAELKESNEKFADKIKSRKLWASVLGTAIMALLSGLGWNIEVSLAVVSPLFAFIFGQAGVDALKALKKPVE